MEAWKIKNIKEKNNMVQIILLILFVAIRGAIAWSKGDDSMKWFVIIVGVIVFLWLLGASI